MDFKYLLHEFSGELLERVKQKSMYLYEYMNSFKGFFDDKLHDRREVFSSLKDKRISEKDFLHAADVWILFKMKTIGDYHDLCLKIDVLLLVDVFEKLIDVCLDYYRLDPCQNFCSPGLSWDAMLKMTEIELELISGILMYLFAEKGMRGGISYFAKRYRKANNEYMKS